MATIVQEIKAIHTSAEQAAESAAAARVKMPVMTGCDRPACAEPEARQSAVAGMAAASAPNVLLVEDDPLLRECTAEMLAQAGCEVRCAASADEALAALRQGPPPHVLVTDIGLAGGQSGLDLARTVARDWPGVKLLIVSGMARPPSTDYPEGALFFTKPYAPGALLAMVTRADW